MSETIYYTTTISSPVGPLVCIVDTRGAVVRIEFPNGASQSRLEEIYVRRGVRLVEDAERTAALRSQLEEYFAGRRRGFDLEVAPEGTAFQKSVWAELRRIPYGETRSYGQLASRLGKPGAARAVGRANGSNPIPIVVPCHRVIGADGSLTGFGGGVEVKAKLLDLEGGAR